MERVWQEIITFITGTGWALEVFAIVLLTMVLHYAETLVYKRLYNHLIRTNNIWDDTIVKALHRPLGFYIWILGLTIAADVVGQHAKEVALFEITSPIRAAGTLTVLIWFMIRFIRGCEQELLKNKPGRKPVDKTTVHAVGQLLCASVVITGVLIGLQMFGIPVSGVVAFGGIGAAGIAFAAKDLLANFFGGLVIYLDRPFSVGDWIRSPDRQIEGTVEYIGWRLTRIRTFDKRPLYVPNGTFSTISVENPSRMTNRRIRTNIGIRYDDAEKMSVILADVEKMLREHDEIDSNQTLMVNLIEFGPSALNFMVYTFTKTTDWVKFQAIQQDVYLKIIDIIAQHGAQCAFPTTTLHVPDGIQLQQASTT